MKRVLFLDIDGVLNAQPFLEAMERPALGGLLIAGKHRNYDPADMIDPVAVDRLNRILDGLDVWLVLSSSWRVAYELTEMQDFLMRKGFRHAIHDATPSTISGRRHEDITRYLADNEPFDRLCIIDDGSDAGEGRESQFIHTTLALGLEERHIEETRRMLA